jgi:hypothetical protein
MRRPPFRAILLLAVLAALLAASATAAPTQNATFQLDASAGDVGSRTALADVPQELLGKLQKLNRKLQSLIDDLEADKLGADGFRTRIGEIQKLRAEILGDFPDVYGLIYLDVWGPLRRLDVELRKARAAFPTQKDIVEHLDKAESERAGLEQKLRERQQKGEFIRKGLLEAFQAYGTKLRQTLSDVRDGKLTDKEAFDKAIDELEKAKYKELLNYDLWPLVFGTLFDQIFRWTELMTEEIVKADDAFRAGKTKEAIDALGEAKKWKELLEDKLHKEANRLSLGVCVTHDRIPGRVPLGDDFRAQLRTIVTTEPRTKVEITATASEPDAFVGGADSSKGTATTGKKKTVVIASVEIVKPVTFTVTVKGARTITVPRAERSELAAAKKRTKRKTVTTVYEATETADGVPCPGDTLQPPPEEPPTDELRCSFDFDPFDSTEVVLHGSCSLATAPGRPAPRAPLGVSITRLDFKLRSDRQVTNWLNPAGLTCAQATRTTANDTLRCSGNVALGASISANIRMSPGPVAGMGGDVYAIADGVEQGPFPITGP